MPAITFAVSVGDVARPVLLVVAVTEFAPHLSGEIIEAPFEISSTSFDDKAALTRHEDLCDVVCVALLRAEGWAIAEMIKLLAQIPTQEECIHVVSPIAQRADWQPGEQTEGQQGKHNLPGTE